jgi:hypothetical protein
MSAQIPGRRSMIKIIRFHFRFTGKLNKLTLRLEPPALTESDKMKPMQAHRNNVTSQ